MRSILQGDLETNFDNFITANTITQEQANKIKEVINTVETDKRANIQMTRIMTEKRSEICINSENTN